MNDDDDGLREKGKRCKSEVSFTIIIDLGLMHFNRMEDEAHVSLYCAMKDGDIVRERERGGKGGVSGP